VEVDKQCIVCVRCFADDEQGAKALIGPITKGAPIEGILFTDELAPKTMNQLFATVSALVARRHAVETLWAYDVAGATRCIGHKFLSTPLEQTLVYTNYRSNPMLPSDAAYLAI
jgi:hypothetical protein|tara:strand:- start:379 stop:720 length:342 start_codon:yes stop_codon:yes gene_type:complete